MRASGGQREPAAGSCASRARWQTRTFSYDSLKRLSAAINPEMGGSSLDYWYDDNGNLTSKLSSGSTDLLISYTYDSLNRVQTRGYSDGMTPPVTYCYDGRTWNGSFGGCSGTPSMPSKQRLTEVGTTVSRTYYGYNAAGQVTESTQTTAGQSYTFGYSYTAAMALASETYPSGRVITTAYDDDGRAKYVKGQNGSVVTYYAGNLSNSIAYASHGAISSMPMGNGIAESRTYNSRLQPTVIQAGSLLTVLNCYQTSDDPANCTSLPVTPNNGNVQRQRITRGGQSWVQNYAYDAVNRLSTASETSVWSQTYGYDAYGNRWLSSSSGLPVSPLTQTSSTNFNAATNRLTGSYTYDWRGNLTSYGSYTLAYDGDDKVISASGTIPSTRYEYDGEGRRVRAHSCPGTSTCNPGSNANTTIFVYDAFGKLAMEYRPETAPAGTSYYTQDHLGSTRLETNASGQAVRCSDYLPFGEEIPAGYGSRSSCFNPNDNKIKFTSKERDAETGLDFFGARYMSAAQGRFMIPDPSSGRIAPLDPQSWNKYSYVRNRPTRFVDPNGYWATEIHVNITTFALKDYVSSGEFRALVNQQRIMDKNLNGPSDKYMHAMSNGDAGESAAVAKQKMQNFIAFNLQDAKANLRSDGSFSDLSLLRLGSAIHTAQDSTSSVHMKGGEPIAWNGIFSLTSIPHGLGENSPSDNWAGIGQAIRLTMGYFMQVNPEQAREHGLTDKTFDAKSREAISNYINWFQFDSGFSSAGEREAARQCALNGGAGAACVH